MNLQDYEVVIRPLPLSNGGSYLASVPELPGCKSDRRRTTGTHRPCRDTRRSVMESGTE